MGKFRGPGPWYWAWFLNFWCPETFLMKKNFYIKLKKIFKLILSGIVWYNFGNKRLFSGEVSITGTSSLYAI